MFGICSIYGRYRKIIRRVMLKFNSLSPYDNGSYKLPNADATKFGRTKGRQRCKILTSL